jgi:hypothetical protein
MLEELSPRRKKIARGDIRMPEAFRRQFIQQWATEGFDVAEFSAAYASVRELKLRRPDVPVSVDVVVPFCESDVQFVAECVEALKCQKFADVLIHLVNDGAKWPVLPRGPIVRYKSPHPNQGPYRLTNSIYHNLKREFMALNDADDLSLPDRFWVQVQQLRYYQSDMISSGMQNFLADNENRQDLVDRCRSPLTPGKRYKACPLGYGINGTRLMRHEVFQRLNGFADEACGMDHDFCNRARFAGVKVVDDETILAKRRLRSDSLSNGGAYQLGSKNRKRSTSLLYRNLRAITQSPTVSTAASLGHLNKSQTIYSLPAGMLY